MARWELDAQGLVQQGAMELLVERSLEEAVQGNLVRKLVADKRSR